MNPASPPRALVISHEDASGSGFVGERLAQRGYQVETHVVVPDPTQPGQATMFPDQAEFDVVVVMGSYWSVYDTESIGGWISDEIELIASAHAADTPVLGICFGGQALAAALGGSVQKADVTEIGWYEIDPTTADAPFPRGPWLEWHHDCFTLPPGAELLATTPDAPQLFRIGRSLGTQFHPEINVELATEWLEAATDEYLAAHGVSREAILADVAAHEDANRINAYALVDWFLDDVARLTHPAPTQ